MQQKKDEGTNEEMKREEGDQLNSSSDVKHKRPPIDKQAAFIQYKDEGQGKNLESAIVEYRNDIKAKRNQIKIYT